MEKSTRECKASFITNQGWNDILKLSTDFPEQFFDLPNEIERFLNIWQEWYDLDAPESAEYPCNYSNKLGPFQVLMFLRCFRIDRLYRAIGNYVSIIMGEEYIMPPVISFDSILEQSNPYTPIIFVLSPGSDPTAELMKLADR